MGRPGKLLDKVLRGSSDANIAFEDLCQMLRRWGFEERTSGSHHNFRKAGVEAKINLQEDKSKANAYRVRQVRTVLGDNNLVPEETEEV